MCDTRAPEHLSTTAQLRRVAQVLDLINNFVALFSGDQCLLGSLPRDETISISGKSAQTPKATRRPATQPTPCLLPHLFVPENHLQVRRCFVGCFAPFLKLAPRAPMLQRANCILGNHRPRATCVDSIYEKWSQTQLTAKSERIKLPPRPLGPLQMHTGSKL